jgi:hypothetical protein
MICQAVPAVDRVDADVLRYRTTIDDLLFQHDRVG